MGGDTAEDSKTIIGNEEKVSEQGSNADSKTSEEDGAQLYGWFRFTPGWLQCLNKPIWFLVFMCFAVLGQSMVVNGLIAVSISSLETRFDLTSSQAGTIPSTYELAGIPVMLIVGYYGGIMHKPRWISLGMFLLSVASLLYALPHFTTGLYEWSGSVDDNLCHRGSNRTSDCDEDSSSSLSDYLYVFISSAALMAFGASPVYILGAPYIDDCLPADMSACYLGVFYAMSSLGPAIAYICGGALLSVYTDFHSVDMEDIPLEPGDPRWVGAWWIGFLFTWALNLAVVLPLSGFPKFLPGTEDIRNAKMASKGDDSEDVDVAAEPFRGSCKQLPGIIKDLFTNFVYICAILAPVGDTLIVVGFAVFGPKYVENQFSVSAGLAAGLFGLITVPGAAGGTILGGWIVKHWKLSLEQCIKVYAVMCVLVLLCIGVFFIQCDNPPFAGVSVFDPAELSHFTEDVVPETSSDLHFPCNQDCECSQDQYEPVCSEMDIIFFSPCFAGCTGELENGDTIFYNCSCVGQVNNTGGTATPGVCDASYCSLMPLFFVFMFFAMLLVFSAGIVQLSICLRCVRGDSRPLALSIGLVVGRLLGAFPAPVIFGASMDASCILWSEKCGETGSCLYYDNSMMAWYMLAVCVGCKLWNITFAVLAWVAFRYQKKKKKAYDSDEIVAEISIKDTTADEVLHKKNSHEVLKTDKGPETVGFYGSCATEGHTNIGFDNIGVSVVSDSYTSDDTVSTHL